MLISTNTPLKNPPKDYSPTGCEHWYVLKDGYDAGKTMFYYDFTIGDGEPAATLLMVHGNPESSYTYRHIRDYLTGADINLRIIAMDHIGFGLSDQADFEMIDMHHAANLIQLVRELQLEDVTLLVHDWGGPIGIGALLQDHWRVKNLVVLNTTVFPMPEEGLTYKNFPITWLPWCRVPKLVPNRLWGGVAGYVVSHAKPQSNFKFVAGVLTKTAQFGLGAIPKGSPDYVWSESLRSVANAKSSKRNVQNAEVWGHGYSYQDKKHGRQDNHDFCQFIQTEIVKHWGVDGRNISACGVFGQWDACGKDEVIMQWQQALPSMKERTLKFPESGHFVEESNGDDIAEAVLSLLAEA
ncbi:Haloalkane dehalogenase [Zhongshania aliphaticivorans]|uniref:Haloalkane dehalogenase n=1 Tax=Zhongshania aliphaticivorans TaxID=1470434 RepID=A0A5S9QK56_9GAMM|nr:alpha/beta hydrolase [Zhongshania aliphaticivorans]CAA0111446.1 Haloalkane dehalogenase [Zhongshania aliphaticivorans]CAA0118635.1 Haloalkane dehalogenase [Zhongshania aliphaticivorans]